MNKYQNGKIYKITSLNTTDIYIGSTIHPLLCQRFSKHNSGYKNWLKDNNKTYCSSYKVLKYGDCKIELIKLFPCSCIDELHAEEGKHQRELKCVNKNISGRTKKEYRIDNKEKKTEQNSEYRINNKDNIKQYYQDNKEKITDYKSEYYIDNKEKLNEQSSEYRLNNKEKIAEKASQIITCTCGCEVRRSGLSRHKQTEKHLNLL